MSDVLSDQNTKESMKLDQNHLIQLKRLSYESAGSDQDKWEWQIERKLFEDHKNNEKLDNIINSQSDKLTQKESQVGSQYSSDLKYKNGYSSIINTISQRRQQSQINPFEYYKKSENIQNHQTQQEEEMKSKTQGTNRFSTDLQREKAMSQGHLTSGSIYQQNRQGVNMNQFLPQNVSSVKLPLGKKYLDTFRRRETLKIMNKHSSNQLILQYDKFMNTHIYDNKFISQRQRQVKQDYEFYVSDLQSDLNNSITTKNQKYQTISSNFKNNFNKQMPNMQQITQQFLEEQNGFNSERLHYNETYMMSRKNNEQIKERNKFRYKKYSINTNPNDILNLRNQQDSLGTPFSVASPLQNSVIGTYRSRFFEKNINDGKITSRNSIAEEQASDISNGLQQLLVKSHKIDNLNDDFHRMSTTQKKAYYKSEKFNMRALSNIKLGMHHSIANDSLLKNDEKDINNETKNVFKQYFDRQKMIQNQKNLPDNQKVSYQLNNNESQQFQKQNSQEQIPSRDNLNNNNNSIGMTKKLATQSSYQNGDQNLETTKKQYLHKDVLETRKKIALQKGLQEQVIKLTQLKNPQEYQSIYKLLKLKDEQKGQFHRQQSNDKSVQQPSNNTNNLLPDIQTPQKISLLILSQSKDNVNNNSIPISGLPAYSTEKQIAQKTSPQRHPHFDKLIEYGNGNQNQVNKQITKDEYLNEWVNGLQGLEIEPNGVIVNEGDEEEDEADLNFFLKSQQITSSQRRDKRGSQKSTTKSREPPKTQQSQNTPKTQQSEFSSTKTTLKILSYQSNKPKQDFEKLDGKSNIEELIINQIKTNKQQQNVRQATITSDKGISISSFENLDKDNKSSSKQMKYISHISNSIEQSGAMQPESLYNIQNIQNGKQDTYRNIMSQLEFNASNDKEFVEKQQGSTKQIQTKRESTLKEISQDFLQKIPKTLPQIIDGKQMQILDIKQVQGQKTEDRKKNN